MAALPPSIRFLEKAILDPNMAFNTQRGDGIRLLQAALAYPDKLDLLYRFMHPKVSMLPYYPLTRECQQQLMTHAMITVIIGAKKPHGRNLEEMQPHALSWEFSREFSWARTMTVHFLGLLAPQNTRLMLPPL